ncbi:hypothetical protein FF041_26435 [Streptomyces jumonjinensis]|uniref:Uncharacterized protein n=1 Tax=Streptomyces jumonjinensis TaxID=1945 RepID=A0A646KMM7_STRJU|nr:hypothetical protein [Streptomyces jumonjinensis]
MTADSRPRLRPFHEDRTVGRLQEQETGVGTVEQPPTLEAAAKLHDGIREHALAHASPRGDGRRASQTRSPSLMSPWSGSPSGSQPRKPKSRAVKKEELSNQQRLQAPDGDADGAMSSRSRARSSTSQAFHPPPCRPRAGTSLRSEVVTRLTAGWPG